MTWLDIYNLFYVIIHIIDRRTKKTRKRIRETTTLPIINILYYGSRGLIRHFLTSGQ